MNALAEAIGNLNRLLQLFPASLTQLVLRVGVSLPFWNSGVLKWESFPTQINETAVLLFSDEFKLHLFGAEIPFPLPAITAHLVALAEVTLPALLVAGLLSRFAAVGLLLMTVVIQLTVPSGWAIHLTWAAMALAIVSYGGGQLSLDRVFGIER
jgi:putative oxidoreductase